MINIEEYSKKIISACIKAHKFIDAESKLITKYPGNMGILEAEVISLHIAMGIFLTQFKQLFELADKLERNTELRYITILLKGTGKEVIKNLGSLVENLPQKNENIASSTETIPHAG